MFCKYTIGVDEVGRGSLAGPVAVAAVAMPIKFKINGIMHKNRRLPLKDSKGLTAKQRLVWRQWIEDQLEIKFALARAYPKTIDKMNITRATNIAVGRALKKLLLPLGGIDSGRFFKIFLDGGLKLNFDIPYKVVIRGDQKYDAIKLASIVAKVHRDAIMVENHRQYKQYGFERHKGYGTKQHLQAIRKYGACPLHRISFISKFVNTI